jgi:hypothetical protein
VSLVAESGFHRDRGNGPIREGERLAGSRDPQPAHVLAHGATTMAAKDLGQVTGMDPDGLGDPSDR